MNKPIINPLVLVALKQRVGAEDTAAIELPVLLHFDAAKRGQCTAAGVNFLTSHLIIASYLASRLRSQQFHDHVTAADAALQKAAKRDTEPRDLTTGEYQLLRKAFSWYFRAMPSIEVGMMDQACKTAERMIKS